MAHSCSCIELEEGEIVEDLEDILSSSGSDIGEAMNSGAKCESYKRCVPRCDAVKGLSDECNDSGVVTHSRLRIRPTRRTKKSKRVNRKCAEPSSESEADEKIKNQIKRAVHIDGDATKVSSLHKRLNLPLACDKMDEEEQNLAALRIEALKTAFLSKSIRRKKRKEQDLKKEQQCEQKTLDPDEDEDLLRASLLASMSKKIINDPPKPKPKECSVKPLIINIQNDSDDESEDDTYTRPDVTETKGKDKQIVMESEVSKFLNEQRMKVEKLQQKKGELLGNGAIAKSTAVDLLPKSQQLEYYRLIKKLRMAEKKQSLKKTNRFVRKIDNRVAVQKGSTGINLGLEKCDVKNNEITNSKNDLLLLQKVMKSIRVVTTNGSLQSELQSGYETVRPTLRKISSQRMLSRRYEIHIRALEEQLKRAKHMLAQSNLAISRLVREIVREKNKIDQRICRQVSIENRTKSATIANPNTPDIPNPNVTENIGERLASTEWHITDPNDIVINWNSNSSRVVQQPPPNGIHPKVAAEDKILKYVSPLNQADRYVNMDPLAIMCPYEVNGSCRDRECTYNHYASLNR